MLPQRIVILGNAGSGKSTLARRLGERLGLPVVHLDRLFWGPGWSPVEAGLFRERVRQAVAGERWICEGNYDRRTFDLRLPRADLIVWLEIPRLTCLARVVRRTLLHRPRPDFPEDCVERLDAEYLGFLRYVWTFDRRKAVQIEQQRRLHGPCLPVLRLRSAGQIAAFLASPGLGMARCESRTEC